MGLPIETATERRNAPAVPNARSAVQLRGLWGYPLVVVESKVHGGSGSKHSFEVRYAASGEYKRSKVAVGGKRGRRRTARAERSLGAQSGRTPVQQLPW